MSNDLGSSELKHRVLAAFSSPRSERSLVQLYEAAEPASFEQLHDAVAELLESAALSATYRVHSPFGDRPGLIDVESLEDVPSHLEDAWQDPPQAFEVGLGDIEVVFKKR